MINSTPIHFFNQLQGLHHRFTSLLLSLAPAANLVLRLWVANIFFKSALTKVMGFETTIMLFTHEYTVPLLSPVIAAYLGTAIELIFPLLLVCGLAGRFSAALLFLFNIVATVSYPEISDAGVRDHIVWGIMLFALMTYGPGKWSLDHLIQRHFERK